MNDILIKPAPTFAFLKTIPLLILSVCFLLLAWWSYPGFIILSLLSAGFAAYRYAYIRSSHYTITPEVIRISRGIIFKRRDQVEMFRIKDYIITQPLSLQIFRLMDLTLKTTDPENPIIWMRGIPL